MAFTFAIVGTAGRKDDAQRLSVRHFVSMYDCARILIEQLNANNYLIDTIISGGAAWADHVAVKLFLQQKELFKLKLFLPCPYNMETKKYDESPLNINKESNRYSIGTTINYYHLKFSRTVGFDSFAEIHRAIKEGAEVVVKNGFRARNVLVADSDVLLAITFGNKEWVKPGGTSHTVMTYLNRVKKHGLPNKSFHYDLNNRDIFFGAKVR